MRIQNITPSTPIWTPSQLAYPIALDADLASDTDLQTYLLDLQATAIAYAEKSMGCSLITREIVASFWLDDGYLSQYPYVRNNNLLFLPYGPIQEVSTVVDELGSIAHSDIQGWGNSDAIVVPRFWQPPLIVTYTAGYGDASDIPADIRGAIRSHVVYLYENRASASGQALNVCPQSLNDFYRLNRRTSTIR